VTARRLKVDWPACRARGLCFELLPEAIDLDEWGYPIIGAEIPLELHKAAREAVRSCPTLALRLWDDGQG
jgi:ferredoxin